MFPRREKNNEGRGATAERKALNPDSGVTCDKKKKRKEITRLRGTVERGLARH